MPQLILAALAVATLSLPVSADVQYAISVLGSVPGGDDTIPTLINASQIIVGGASGDFSPPGPYFLSGGAPVPLAPPPAGSVFSPNTINASGTMAGFFFTDLSNPSGPSYMAALYQDGQYVQLPVPAGSPTSNFRVQAINNAGEAVGFVQENDKLGRAVAWTNGQPAFVDPNPTASSSANGINDQGWIAGGILSASARIATPVVWRNGVMTTISLPASSNGGTALAVNDAGQVLVSYFALFDNPPADGPYGEERLLLWDDGNETLLPEFTGASWQGTFADAMNNFGDVVGYSGGRAVLWHDGQIEDLGTRIDPNSGWVLTNAISINDAGDIVGYGVYQGVDAPFLLMPVVAPEPTNLGVLALGGLWLIRRRWSF